MIRNKWTTLFAAAAFAAAAPLSGHAQDPDLSGSHWQTEDDKFILRVTECAEDELCADLVWLLRPLDKDTRRPKLDEHNPDTSLRTRPVCGMRLVTGLRADGDGEWEDGRFYNPDDGNTYSASMERRAAADLRIRAYLGVKMLGKTLRMRPVEAPTESCEDRGEAAMADIENYVAKTPGSPWVPTES